MATETCAGCRFFAAGTTTAFPNAHGMCRHYAPTGPVIGSHADGFQLFPPMMAHQWCGDCRPEPVSSNAMRAAA